MKVSRQKSFVVFALFIWFKMALFIYGFKRNYEGSVTVFREGLCVQLATKLSWYIYGKYLYDYL